MKITIELSDALYSDLERVAKDQHETGYGPQQWASDLLASELASRRLVVTPGKTESYFIPAEYRLALPEKRV